MKFSSAHIRSFLQLSLTALLLGTLMPGCVWSLTRDWFWNRDDHFETFATEIEYPDVETLSSNPDEPQMPPIMIADNGPKEYWDLELTEAIRIGLTNSTVLRDFGGTVVRQPDAAPTVYDPALQDTDAQGGVDAALAAFDAQFNASIFAEKNDRQLNNQFFGGGVRTLKQDLTQMAFDVTKRSAFGTQYIMRKTVEYDFNNSPGNQFPGAWTVNLEGEFRHPLMQGSGLDFNRIAGPNGQPGVYNGVLIARIKTDVELAEFQVAVREVVSNIENAYWELYFAYRDLDAKVASRDRALAVWRRIRDLLESGQANAAEEARARRTYHQMDAVVQDALVGRLSQRTTNEVAQFNGGVHMQERRLRLAMGLPPGDSRLIRPAQEAGTAKVVFNWDEALFEALTRRAELRKQQWQIKRAELELTASRNFLLPNFDVVGRYRFRGFGQELLNSTGGQPRFDNAYQDLLSGDFQELQLGMEMQLPIGFRQAHAAVRNAQLNLVRQHAILDEQEHQISHALAEALAETERAYELAQSYYNQRLAARQQLEALLAQDQLPPPPELFAILEAQRSLSDAESNFYQALAEYNVAVKRVHLSKGSLLEFNDVYLAEGPWPHKAYHDAAERERRQVGPWGLMNYVLAEPTRASRGAAAQRMESAGMTEVIDEEATGNLPTPPQNRQTALPPASTHNAGRSVSPLATPTPSRPHSPQRNREETVQVASPIGSHNSSTPENPLRRAGYLDRVRSSEGTVRGRHPGVRRIPPVAESIESWRTSSTIQTPTPARNRTFAPPPVTTEVPQQPANRPASVSRPPEAARPPSQFSAPPANVLTPTPTAAGQPVRSPHGVVTPKMSPGRPWDQSNASGRRDPALPRTPTPTAGHTAIQPTAPVVESHIPPSRNEQKKSYSVGDERPTSYSISD